MLTELTNVISPGQQGRKKNGVGCERAGAVTFKQLCVSLKLNHRGGPNSPLGLGLSIWLLYMYPNSAQEELGMDIPPQGIERVALRHGPSWSKMGTCAFVEPVQQFEHKGKCLGSC